MVPAQKPLPTQATLPPQNTVEYWVKIVIGLCIVVLTVNVALLVYQSFRSPKKTPSLSSESVKITGTLDINGYIPPDALVDIYQKKSSETDFILASSGISPTDGGVWEWNDARMGIHYDLKAVLRGASGVIAESFVKSVTAPAENETLRLVSSSIPPSPTQQPVATPGVAQQETNVISGKLDINGYIPSGATVTIQAKKPGDTSITIIATLSAGDGASWTFPNAQTGVIYELQAHLISNGTTIGSSQTLSVAAPAQNEVLSINSKASSQVTNQSISGIFDINGYIPKGATVAIAVRKSGTPNFATVITELPPTDNTSWNIGKLQNGISYDVLAYLQVNGQNYAQSQLLVVPAPAYNETLVINSQNRAPAPNNATISVSCVGKNNNNQWQTTVKYNQTNVDPNVKQFILQIGTNGGDANILNNQIAPASPTQGQSYSTNFLFTEGQTYYVQYAYSTCANCSDINFFSQFTSPLSFRCVPSPTPTITPIATATPYPTYTPYPTPTPNPTNTPAPSATPIPTSIPTPKISSCNQSCGSDGYTCVDGLVCVNEGGGQIGGTVCRNANCPTKETCTCE